MTSQNSDNPCLDLTTTESADHYHRTDARVGFPSCQVTKLFIHAKSSLDREVDHARIGVGIDEKGSDEDDEGQVLTSVNFGWAETDSLGCRKHPSTDDHHL